MKDTLTFANHRDFSARYLHTYGFFTTESGRRMLVFVQSVNGQEVLFANKDGQRAGDCFRARADQNIEFEFIPVTRSYYNTARGAILLYRQPARQWKRGISADNTSARLLTHSLQALNVDYELLDSIFFGTPQGYMDEWQALVSGKKPSAAVSCAFALNKEGHVYFYNKCVGTWKDDQVTLVSPLVLQELTDAFKRGRIPLKVTAQ